MRNLFIVRKDTLRRLYQIPCSGTKNLVYVEKRTVARWLLYIGLFISFYGTLAPWFLWSINRYVPVLASVPLILGILLSRNIKHPIFNRKDYYLPLLCSMALLFCMALTSGKNFNAIFMTLFSAVGFLALFKLDASELRRAGDVLTLSMAWLLFFSIPFYMLYLLGFNIPHSSLAPADWDYSFENYRFFLIDDRSALQIVPRFHSYFLEPSHLGMACIGLLYSQIGKWKTWRCRILFLAIIMTFSLAAYLCLVVMLFSAAWMRGKAILGKVLLLLGIGVTIVVVALTYRKGDNLFNQLIIQRMTINNDGQLEGDNRTSDLFTKEYDKMMDSGQAFWGKGMEAMQRFGNSGNSGYRVYIYTYGIVTVLALVVFFFFVLRTSKNTRAKISMSIISLLSFVAHGIPTKSYWFIPLYILLFSDVLPHKKQEEVEEEQPEIPETVSHC